jgi:hypothetical protein
MIGDLLKHHWLRHEVDTEPGVSESDLNNFESKYSVSLPTDLRDYFVCVNGMSPDVSDEALIRFWMLDEIKPISEGAPEYADQSYIQDPDSVFLFADYCIWSHAYAIRLSSEKKQQPNTIFIIGYPPSIPIADSFSEFVDIYLKNKAQLVSGF